ncbi:hypothetical protein N9T92_01985 [Candidatus Pelagibacter sp.]|nr:hypothetical protein [Candidatus Pelagibacter sp.]
MKKLINSVICFAIVFATTFIFNTDDASAHLINGKKHKPIRCVLPKDRDIITKSICKQQLKNHRLCRAEEHCAILRIKKLEDNVEDANKEVTETKKKLNATEQELLGTATCGDLVFNHKTNRKTSLHILPNKKSKKIAELEKNKDLLFISPSSKNKNWYFVKIKKENTCADGFIEQKFVVKKAGEDVVVKVGPKLIEINQPNWAQEDKLILINAEGTVSITGAIQEGKIDQIIINEEEEIINSDNSFTYLLFVPSSGSEVRIVGNKNGKKVKELTFKVKVGK